MKFFKPAICLFLSIALLSSCKKDKADSPKPVNKIAYIYKADQTDALAFKSLLEANNCSVTLVDKTASASTDFSGYSLIVVGHNTDGTQVLPSWTTAEATAISTSNKPVLLVGVGGLQLGLKLNNDVNYGLCASNNLSSFLVSDASDIVYKSPKTLTVGNNQPLEIFSSASFVQCYNSNNPHANPIQLIGKEEPGSAYYPLAIENNRYGVFGYSAGVSSMTAAGRDFMVNLVYKVGKF